MSTGGEGNWRQDPELPLDNFFWRIYNISMPEKSSKAKKLPVSIPSVSIPKVKIPRIRFNNSLYMPLLIILLIVASFLLGVLVTKVQYLEKGVGRAGREL